MALKEKSDLVSLRIFFKKVFKILILHFSVPERGPRKKGPTGELAKS